MSLLSRCLCTVGCMQWASRPCSRPSVVVLWAALACLCSRTAHLSLLLRQLFSACTHTVAFLPTNAARTRSAWPVACETASLWELYSICLRRNKAKALFKTGDHLRAPINSIVIILWFYDHGFHARPACVYPNYTRKLFWKQKYRKKFLS